MKKYHLTVLTTILFLLCSIFFLITPAQSSAISDSIEQSIGIGLGLPYGIFGVNYEVALNSWFAPTIGLGFCPAGLAWNLGARLYYPSDTKFKVRLTALYGTNMIIEDINWWGDGDYSSEEGFSAGFGFNWRYGKNWSFDTDFFVVDTDPPAGYEEYGPDIKISLGFNRRF